MDFAPLDSFPLDKKQISTVNYANFGERLLAYILDALVLMIPIGFGVYMLSMGQVVYMIIGMLIVMLYKPVLEGLYGATLGKKVLSIKVVDQSHQIIDLGKSLIRNSFFIASTIPNLLLYLLLANNVEFLEAETIFARIEVQRELQGNLLEILSYVMSFIVLISCLFVAFDTKKYQALHDKFASTYVIKNNPFG